MAVQQYDRDRYDSHLSVILLANNKKVYARQQKKTTHIVVGNIEYSSMEHGTHTQTQDSYRVGGGG